MGQKTPKPSFSDQFNPHRNHRKFHALVIASTWRGGKVSYGFQLLCRTLV